MAKRQRSMVAIRSSKNSDWISLREVLTYLSRTVGQAEALPQLINRLGGAELECRAAVTLQEADIGLAYDCDATSKYEPRAFEGMNSQSWVHECCLYQPYIAVGTDFFLRGHRWKIDISDVDIDKGMVIAKRKDWFYINAKRDRIISTWEGDEEDVPSWMKEGLIRRVAIGLEFHASDFLELPVLLNAEPGDVPLPQATEPNDVLLPQAAEPNDVPLPVATEPDESRETIKKRGKEYLSARKINDNLVKTHFKDLISTGEFRARFGDPDFPGMRAALIEAYQQELTDRNEDHELSRSTLGRRVNRLLDEYREKCKKRILTQDGA